ncbi:MAG: hypothetical protein JMDDDDMK_01015 [Acidobacteria bacterium]|nr:hypothetical protein [Acidobacteriota bacterium]
MLFAAVGLVAVGDEERVALIAETVFDQRVRFGREQLPRPRLLDRVAHRRIPDPPLPRGLRSPRANAGMRVVIERAVEQPRQPLLIKFRLRHHRVGAHAERFQNALARQTAAGFVSRKDGVKTCVVEQRLLHRPRRRVTNHLDRIAHQLDQRRNALSVMNAAQSHRAPETNLRALMRRGLNHQINERRIVRVRQRANTRDGGKQRFAALRLERRASRFDRRFRIKPRERMQRVSRRDKARQRALVPAAIRVLSPEQGFDAARDSRIIVLVAQSLKRDQSKRGRRRVEFAVGLPLVSIALARIEAPRTVSVLSRSQPRFIFLQLFLNARPKLRRVVGALQLIIREARRGRLSRFAIGRRLRRRWLRRFGRQCFLNRPSALILRDVILREKPLEEFDPVRQVVAVARKDAEHLLSFFFNRGEIARMAGAIPRRAQNLARVVVNHRLADVRSRPGGVDSAGIGCLQRVIGRADGLHRMQLARGRDAFRRADVVTGDARPGGAVADIERREAGVVRRVFQVVRRAQRLVHHVDQAAVVLLVLDYVAVFNGAGRPPDARLRVATHAMRAHQIAGVADAPFDRSAARTIGQPRINLTDVIVHRLPHGHSRIVVRRGLQHAQFDFVTRRVGFGAQVISSARFEQANNRGAMLFVLLMRALVLIAAFGVFDQRARSVERVKPKLRRQRVIRNRQVAGQQPRLLAIEREAKPVIARFADFAVVEILDVIGAARDPHGLNAFAIFFAIFFAIWQRNLLRHLRRVVRLGFDTHVRFGFQPQRIYRHRQRNRLPCRPRRLARERYSLWRDAVFAPARASRQTGKHSGFISDGRNF